jgi:hypothetical protein
VQLSLLQESAVDGADYNQFHNNLIPILQERGIDVETFFPETEGLDQLDF